MATDLDRRAHAVLMEALDADAARRRAVVLDACAGDADLRRRVEDLIGALERSHDFLEAPVLEARRAEPFGVEELAERIPGYRPVRVIGAGGMATVYEAEQRNPRRTVALKVMRLGLMETAALQRFRFETEVLARLDHPGVAQIFEAGAFDDGRGGSAPFYAMEYVADARTITEDAAERQLPLRARLELFAGVCDAVHHGHQVGVIHRDLKPPNILVDRAGRTKVIDFGVARPSAPGQPGVTEQLDRAQLVGTLNYMSPEQCAGEGVDIRTDVYALGVVLYELTAGRLPLDLTGKPAPAAMRDIAEAVRPRPSAVNPAARGDVDAIVMRAIETDPARRYPTVSELAADVRRYLGHEPIQARPATTVYQFRKFARRHRVPVAAAGGVVLALAIGLVAAARMAYVADAARADAARQQARAERAQAVEALARKRAEQEAAIAREVNGFWIDIIERGSPSEARRPDLPVREALDQAARGVGDAIGEPAVRKSIHTALADAYHALGLWEAELVQAQALWDLERNQPSPEWSHALAARRTYARALVGVGRATDASALLERGLSICDDIDAAPSIERPRLLALLARAEERLGAYERAEALIRQAADLFAAQLGDRHPDTLITRSALGRLVHELGRNEEAVDLLAPILHAQRDTLGASHPDAMATLNTMARARAGLGRFEQAEADFRALQALAVETLGEDHDYTLVVQNNLAAVFREAGRPEAAEAVHRNVLAARLRTVGPDDAEALTSAINLAVVLSDLGRFDEAEPLLRDAADRRARTLGPTHPDTLNAVQSLGRILVESGRHDEAAPLYEALLVELRGSLPPGHVRLAPALRNYALVLSEDGRPGDALPLLIESHDILLRVAGPDHPQTFRAADFVCAELERLDRPEELAAWRARRDGYGAAPPR